eukprot:5634375-Pyramimonas_sp.AAC.1
MPWSGGVNTTLWTWYSEPEPPPPDCQLRAASSMLGIKPRTHSWIMRWGLTCLIIHDQITNGMTESSSHPHN